jgi:hypothetical protein
MKDYARTAVAADGTVLEGYIATRNGVIVGKRGKPIGGKKLNSAGYCVVGTTYKTLSVHAIIAATFHGPNSHMVVDHIDGNKLNNRADNLRWVTSSINSLDAHNKSKAPRIAKPVRNLDTGETYRSVSAAARAMGVNSAAIWYALEGRTNTSAGYRWEYVSRGEQLELDL